MKRINADGSFIRLGLALILLAAQFGCAGTRTGKQENLPLGADAGKIEQTVDGLSQQQFDQKNAEIKAKAKDYPRIIIEADSLSREQAKYAEKREKAEQIMRCTFLPATLAGHLFWFRHDEGESTGGIEDLGVAIGKMMVTASFVVSLPLTLWILPKLTSRALIGPKVKPDHEKEQRKLIRLYNGYATAKQDSVKVK